MPKHFHCNCEIPLERQINKKRLSKTSSMSQKDVLKFILCCLQIHSVEQ